MWEDFEVTTASSWVRFEANSEPTWLLIFWPATWSHGWTWPRKLWAPSGYVEPRRTTRTLRCLACFCRDHRRRRRTPDFVVFWATIVGWVIRNWRHQVDISFSTINRICSYFLILQFKIIQYFTNFKLMNEPHQLTISNIKQTLIVFDRWTQNSHLMCVKHK